MANKILKIESGNENLKGLDIYSREFVNKVLKIIEKVSTSANKIGGSKALINGSSPVFKEGSIVDFGSNGEAYTGNVLYFFLNHPLSPVLNDEAKFAKLLEIDEKKLQEMIGEDNRFPSSKSKYSKTTIISNFIPNFFYKNILKDKQTNIEYINDRGIDEDVSKRNSITGLDSISKEFMESKIKNYYLYFNEINYYMNGLAMSFSNNKYTSYKDKVEFFQTKKEILTDFLINAELPKEKKEKIKNDLFKTITTLQKMKSVDLTEEEKKIKDEKLINDYLFKKNKNKSWYLSYFSYNLDSLKEFPIAFPYFNKGNVEAITFRTTEEREDGRKYQQFGSSTVEVDLKKDSKYLFINEGKMDKMSLQTMLKRLNIDEKDVSFVTYLNANMALPYEVIQYIEKNKKTKIINLLDNDNAGKTANTKIFSKLYEKGLIERVSDFSKYIETKNIDVNDINDILNDERYKEELFNDFFKHSDNYNKKIETQNINKSEIIYLKNISELKKYLKIDYKKGSVVYFNFFSKIIKLDESLVNQLKKDLYDKSNEEIDNYIYNHNFKEENVFFLINGNHYDHESVYKNPEKIFLVENPKAMNLKSKSIYELPNLMYKKEVGSEVKDVNELIERFIYEGKETAVELACESKLENKKLEKLEDITLEEFNNWWLEKAKQGAKELFANEDHEFKNNLWSEMKKELVVVNEVYNKFTNEEDKKDFLKYFKLYEVIFKAFKEADIFTGLRGSAGGFLSFSLFGWTNYDARITKYLLENREIATYRRFLNKNKVEMPDMDTEYSKHLKDQANDLFNNFNLFLPIVRKHLALNHDEEQIAKHNCGYCTPIEEIENFITEDTIYLPMTQKEMGVKLKYDGLPQSINRKENYSDDLVLKLDEILFKGLPQITEGVEQSLLIDKNINFPKLESVYLKETKDNTIMLLRLEDNSFVDIKTEKIYTEEDIRRINKTQTLKTYEKDSYILLKNNILTLKEIRKFFPNMFLEVDDIMKKEISMEELMIATSTFRPAFSKPVYYYDNKALMPLLREVEGQENEVYAYYDLNSGINIDFNELPIELKSKINKDISYYTITEKKTTKGDIVLNFALTNGNEKKEDINKVLFSLGYKNAKVSKFGDKLYFTVYERDNNKIQLLLNKLAQELNIYFHDNIDLEYKLFYKHLKENEKKRERLDFLNLTSGYIKYQEQMLVMIELVSQKYAEIMKDKLGDRYNEFINNWEHKADIVRKFTSKTNIAITDEDINKIDEIFIDVEKLLKKINEVDSVLVEEVRDVLRVQLNNFKNGAYLYNFAHAVYVGFNAIQEGIHIRKDKEKNLYQKIYIEGKNETLIELKKEDSNIYKSENGDTYILDIDNIIDSKLEIKSFNGKEMKVEKEFFADKEEYLLSKEVDKALPIENVSNDIKEKTTEQNKTKQQESKTFDNGKYKIKFGKYKDQLVEDIFKEKEGRKYLLYLSATSNKNNFKERAVIKYFLLDNYKFEIGKFSGQTIKEIGNDFKNGLDYLGWFANEFKPKDNNGKNIQKLVQDYLILEKKKNFSKTDEEENNRYP